MNTSKSTKNFMILILVLLAGIIIYGFLTMPDRRNTAEKVGDAISEMPNGIDKAARQLEDRTPGEKLGDKIKDAGDEVKEHTGN